MDMTNVKPVFSIILPLPAGAPSPTETVNSILSQTFRAFELLLVVDGQKEAGLTYVLQRAENDRRIRILSSRSESFSGLRTYDGPMSPAAAKNTGILAARGDYIIFMEPGDMLLPQALQTIYEKAVSPRRPDTAVISFLTTNSDRTDLSFSYPSGYYSRTTLEQGVFPYMIYDPRKKFYSACIYPAAFNRVTSRKILIRHCCREVRISHGDFHSFIHECLYYSESAYFIREPVYIRSVNPWGSPYDPSFCASNMHLMNYLEERLGNEPALKEQLPFLKAGLLLEAVRNEIKSPASPGEQAEHLEREIRDTFALSDINIKDLPQGPGHFLSLLKAGHYRTALALSRLQGAFKNMKGRME